VNFKKSAITSAAAAWVAVASTASAQETTLVGGVTRVTVPANADVRLTVPYNKESVGTFDVNGKAGDQLTANGAGFGDIEGSHYVRLLDGGASGLWSTISSNGDDTVTLANSQVADRVSEGDTFRVYAHHTVGSLFPEERRGASFRVGTELFIYGNDSTTAGQNQPAVGSVSYLSKAVGWFGGPNNQGADTILEPETQFIIRNNDSQPLEIVLSGQVPTHPVAYLLPPSGDLAVGTGYPLAMEAQQTGVGATNRTLFLYEKQMGATNQPATYSLSYLAGIGWFGGPEGSDGQTKDGATVIDGGSAFILRVPEGSGGTKVNVQSPF
jgi:uncharacterized protein (TIGR02597 family)